MLKRRAPRTTYTRKQRPSAPPQKRRRLSPTPAAASPTPTPPPEPRPKRVTSLTRRSGNAAAATAAARPLTQLTLDLGQPSLTTCPQCHMTYSPCDTSLHDRFHTQSSSGIDFPLTASRQVWKSKDGMEFAAVVDGRSPTVEKRRVREALKVVDTELGAAEIAEAALWEGMKVYVYVQVKRKRGRVVGVLVAERIAEGFVVVSGDAGAVEVGEGTRKAVLGVKRVWVCWESRRKGVGRRLLETTRESFVYGMTVERREVAFSQPTDSGGKLARAVLMQDGVNEWLVYKEEV